MSQVITESDSSLFSLLLAIILWTWAAFQVWKAQLVCLHILSYLFATVTQKSPWRERSKAGSSCLCLTLLCSEWWGVTALSCAAQLAVCQQQHPWQLYQGAGAQCDRSSEPLYTARGICASTMVAWNAAALLQPLCEIPALLFRILAPLNPNKGCNTSSVSGSNDKLSMSLASEACPTAGCRCLPSLPFPALQKERGKLLHAAECAPDTDHGLCSPRELPSLLGDALLAFSQGTAPCALEHYLQVLDFRIHDGIWLLKSGTFSLRNDIRWHFSKGVA